MPASAAILLAFADNWVDDQRRLRSLLAESKAISKALAPLVEAGALELPPPVHNATVNDVIETFRERRYRDRIRIFHFGGHASDSKLIFEDEAGDQAEAHAGGLAAYLGRQRGLVLVFLNGCCTEPQVRRLRATGVKAVVATTSAVEDKIAAEFATAFYAELATRSLRDAFDTAVQGVRLRWGDDPRSVTRDVESLAESAPSQWPWIIDCDPDYDGWKVGAEWRDRSWRRRLLIAAAAMSLLLVTSLSISAGARRTACRAPGLHAVCAAVGIGNLPTAAEQALWDAALAQDASDGLRAYLRTYPNGVYADEAKSRLAGCWTKETLGPERAEPPQLLVVNPKHPPTEEEARRDAQRRGDEDAATMCNPRGGAHLFELVSARAEPYEWTCTEDKDTHKFRCGFEGRIVCWIRDRIKSEHCRSQGEQAPRESESQ